ncbi:hypothetical protein [Streptomyces palmae]|uniref:Uncharacterized protein n=1 Tax=Streptomyces palmae TaxID=1701085 RepID=A0A4Z0GJ22_9ACTN|nr:hypothetical protein [Streptomyces palmae]TGA95959.1 hypothetical protein E4099_24505 [Streptomyces palmae]
MSELTMSDLAASMRALRVLVADFPDLPAVNVEVSRRYPGRLELIVHEGLGVFEVWREALGIPVESVTCSGPRAGCPLVLEASVDYAGIRLYVTGFGGVHHPADVLEAVA